MSGGSSRDESVCRNCGERLLYGESQWCVRCEKIAALEAENAYLQEVEFQARNLLAVKPGKRGEGHVCKEVVVCGEDYAALHRVIAAAHKKARRPVRIHKK